MKPWQAKERILKNRAYACEVVVSLFASQRLEIVDLWELSENLMYQYKNGSEKDFDKACLDILKKVNVKILPN
jgi:hypothetical protein